MQTLVYILSAGSAYPENIIKNDLLNTINEFGISQRYSVLPVEYISFEKNQDITKAKKLSNITTSDLGYKSIVMALDRINLSTTDIGLLIGESSTPDQVTPGESNRVGARLGFNGPAYDIVCPSSSFILFINNFLSWKEERLDKNIVCFSTNTPTQFTNFKNKDCGYFGDSASSLVVSGSKAPGFKVIASQINFIPCKSSLLTLPVTDYINFNPDIFEELYYESLKLFKNSFAFAKDSKIAIIPPYLTTSLTNKFIKELAFKNYKVFSNFETTGNCLGSNGINCLADNWEEIYQNYDRLIVFQAGAGLSCGYFYCEKV